ncbi:unnamed protein product [Phytophthora fragariaefolia]|uniref:Unnamed protein product n=1 Tax=Phytophthora fragariaefolia TaxID=1490495 RepID=A0A9W6Y336_9STRA|nr:unnamed protein product [Phytophthora fragariaefolia]
MPGQFWRSNCEQSLNTPNRNTEATLSAVCSATLRATTYLVTYSNAAITSGLETATLLAATHPCIDLALQPRPPIQLRHPDIGAISPVVAPPSPSATAADPYVVLPPPVAVAATDSVGVVPSAVAAKTPGTATVCG